MCLSGGANSLGSLSEGLETIEKITTQSKIKDVVNNTSQGARNKKSKQFNVNHLLTYLPTNLLTSKKVAFTLAEVLITLGIIGIVAAMTIPNLVNNYVERRNVSRVKKIYSDLANVYNLAYANDGQLIDYIKSRDPVPNWYNEESHRAFRDYFAKYFKNLNLKLNFSSAEYYDNLEKTSIYNIGGDYGNGFSTFTAADGTTYAFRYLGTCIGGFADGNYDPHGGCKTGIIIVFLNRNKNEIGQLGKNVFTFSVYKNGDIRPGGWSTIGKEPLSCYSNPNNCTQWVINNGNMDYLHCKDLSWNGKKTCK